MPNFADLLSIAAGTASVVKAGKDFYDQFGYIADDVTVTVYGTPYSSKSELYKLAASLAFSMAQRLGPDTALFFPCPGSATVQYDAAQNFVTFNVKVSNSLAVVLASAAFFPGKPNADALSANLPLFAGPKDEHVGSKWLFNGPGVGAPFVFAIGAPVLPGLKSPDLKRWDNHTILTNRTSTTPPIEGANGERDKGPLSPTMNPRPAVDHRARGSFANLVFSALSTPGTDYDLLYPKPANDLSDYSGG